MHGRIDDLPVFSDDEETARKETKVHDWTPHQSKDISSRIAELRKSLTLSMEKSSDLRSLKASAEKSERERTSIVPKRIKCKLLKQHLTMAMTVSV